MTTELAHLAARDGVSQNDSSTPVDRLPFVPPPVTADVRKSTETSGAKPSGPNGAQIYDVYKAAQTPTERRQVLDYLLAMPSADRSRMLSEVSKEAVRRSDLPSAIAFTNSLHADLKNRERMLPVTDKFGNRFFAPPQEARIPEIATPLRQSNIRVAHATRPAVDPVAVDGGAPPPPPAADKGIRTLQRTPAEIQLTEQVLFAKDSDSSAKLRAAAILAANGQSRLTTPDGGLYQINVSNDRSPGGAQTVSLLYKDNQSGEMQTVSGKVSADGRSAELTAGAGSDRGGKPGTGNDGTRLDARKLFDPAFSPEEKLKLADDLAHQGMRRFQGPDGNQYEISIKDYGNGDSVVVHINAGHGQVRPVLRGMVGKDGSVTEQKDSRGNGVGYAGDWAQKNAPENPLLKHQPVVITGGGSTKGQENFSNGPVKSISIPGWKRADQPMNEIGKETTFSPTGDPRKLQISLFDAARDINDRRMAAYRELLQKSTGASRVLLPQEIRNLDCVLGLSTQGDNQLTNPTKYPDPRAPVFNLSSAQLINVNGRTLLEVQGNFVDRDNKPTNYFRGVYIPSDAHGSHITKLFLQSPDKVEFAKGAAVYRKALQSLEWR